jgi:hypothetical protein
MAYEVFDNKATRLGTPALTITTDGRFALNADAGDLLRSVGAKFAHLLWDAEARKIALRPLTKADSRSYKITVPHAHKRGMTVAAATFLRYIGWSSSIRATLAIEWNDKEKLLEVVLPPDKSSMDKKREVQEVMLEEGRRGRRRVDLEAQRARREKLAEFRKILEIATEAEFVKALLAFGLREGSQEFLKSLEVWREYRS